MVEFLIVRFLNREHIFEVAIKFRKYILLTLSLLMHNIL